MHIARLCYTVSQVFFAYALGEKYSNSGFDNYHLKSVLHSKYNPGYSCSLCFSYRGSSSSTPKVPRRVKGNLAAIAASIYFSTLAFSVIEEAIKISSFPAMAAGFVTGAVSFSIVHPLVKERKELTKILSLLSAQGLFQCCLPTLSPFLHCLGQNNCLLYLSSCCIIAGYILHDRNAMRCTDACY